MGGCSLGSFLFCCKLWGCTYFYYQTVHWKQNTPDWKNYYIRPLYHRPKGRCFTGRSDKYFRLCLRMDVEDEFAVRILHEPPKKLIWHCSKVLTKFDIFIPAVWIETIWGGFLTPLNESFFRELEPATCGAFANAFSGSNSLVPASPAFPASSALSTVLEDSNLRYPWSDRFSRPLYILRMPVLADRVQKLASRVFRTPLYY